MSAVAGIDPPSGDTAFTDTLIANPPSGVEYIRYDHALASGALTIRGRRRKHGRRTAVDNLVFAARAVELSARKSGVMFREPVWWISTRPGEFDLIHQHLFATRQVGARVPVVTTAGYPLPVHYQHQDSWSSLRLRVGEHFERSLSRIAGVSNPWIQNPFGPMGVYTERFQSYLAEHHIAEGQTFVVSTALPPGGGSAARPPRDCVTLGFVGRDFVRKGGPEAIAAFRRLHHDYAGRIRFVVVTGSVERWQHLIADLPDASVLSDVDRRTIVEQVLPSIDILVLPTTSDCGAPYTVLEALQQQCVVVMSHNEWLDPNLDGPAVIRTGGDARSVADAVGSLLDDRDRLARGQAAARVLCHAKFSTDVQRSALLHAYRRAVREAGTAPREPEPPSESVASS